MPYSLKISGQTFVNEVEDSSSWTRSVTRDFNDRIFRTVPDYRFIGHEGLYNLLYNHTTTNGICDALEARIYFDTGTGWDYEWRGDIKPQDFKFDAIRRSVEAQVLDASWSAKFNNSEQQKVFLQSGESNQGSPIAKAKTSSLFMFDPSNGNIDADPRGCYTIYDVFDFLVKYYTDNTVSFQSDYFTSGNGANYVITTGREIRTLGLFPNPEISFSDLFDEMSKKFNLWIVIEGTLDAPVLRVENYDYVFPSQKLIDIVDPEKIDIIIDQDQLYSTVKVGASSTEYDPNNDANYPPVRFEGWDEEIYNLSVNCSFDNTELNLVSSWAIDHNTIEKQYATVGQDGGEFDDTIFIVEVSNTGTDEYTAVKYTEGLNIGTSLVAYYNDSLSNQNVIDNWFKGIPSAISKELSSGFNVRVNTPTTTSGVDLQNDLPFTVVYNNDSTGSAGDPDNIYTTPTEDASKQGQFLAPTKSFYKFSAGQIWQDGTGTDVLIESAIELWLVVDVFTDDTLSELRASYVLDTVAGAQVIPAFGFIIWQGSRDVYMLEGNVAQVRIRTNLPGSPLLAGSWNTRGGDCIVSTNDIEYPEATDDPFIFTYDIGQHELSRTDFDTINQGLGFVRIIDTAGKKRYDVYCKSVKFNSNTCTIEAGEFIGGRPPTELCWILQDGTWDDSCNWLDSEYWNG